ncbi:hypothetical protein [Bacillus pinisoli]|uniref:hypothetical protein n=1 Tax=Bacillus pinisoli TaxID=2901866 RepID=UPI001FF2574C|nr:hypothetical protein [Bacillus pinisoli]
MVAAIVIPIIFLYFLIITLKERKRKYEEYYELDHIKEEAFITGKVVQFTSKQKKFIGNHYVYVTTLIIVNQKLSRIKAVRVSTAGLPIPISEETNISCYGFWNKDYFTFHRYKILD